MRVGLSYDDVALVPRFNNIDSRTHPNLTTQLAEGCPIQIPILASNMDTVIGPALAEVLIKRGSIPIFHRFYKNKNELIDLVNKYPHNSFISCGVKADDLLVLEKTKPRGVCIDIAHGHSKRVMSMIEFIKKQYPELAIIAGNVCTPEAFRDLVNAGASAVKVGIGPGAVCTTRDVTGFGVPQFTAVHECGQVARELKIPMIADGGIRSSREIVLALAAGASSVMVGKLFAETHQAAGNGTYRGQASSDFQEEFYGQVKEGTVPEGVVTYLQVMKDATVVIDELLGGLRSGLTYGGARSIKELQRKAQFIRVTRSYR